jgi:hypothetical protein
MCLRERSDFMRARCYQLLVNLQRTNIGAQAVPKKC